MNSPKTNNIWKVVVSPTIDHIEETLPPGDPEISEFEYLERYVNEN